MFKNFIEKRVEITVSFSASFIAAGSVPVIYTGIMISSDEKLTVVNLSSTKSNAPQVKSQTDSGTIAINNTYIISVKVI